MEANNRQLTTTERNAVAAYRSMTDWLCSLTEVEYRAYLAMPFAIRLATFRGLGLGCAQDKSVDFIDASPRPYRHNQGVLFGT